MNTIQEIIKINERELELGLAGTNASWHETYRSSAWIYVGNLSFELTEGDVLCVLSQYGELDDLWLVRNDSTGVSRGFAYAKYEDARSCVLAVDNLIGIMLCGRNLRVEHVDNMRLPEKLLQKKNDEEGEGNVAAGPTIASQAYGAEDLANQYSIHHGQDLFAPPPPAPPAANVVEEPQSRRRDDDDTKKKRKKEKSSKEKNHKKSKRDDKKKKTKKSKSSSRRRHHSKYSSSSSSSSDRSRSSGRSREDSSR